MPKSNWQDAVITQGRHTQGRVLSSTRRHNRCISHPPQPEDTTMTAGNARRTTAMRSGTAAVGAIAVAGALLLTGCGDQTKDGGSDSGTANTDSAPLADK